MSVHEPNRIKQRPAAVVSSRAYNIAKPDVIVMTITSQFRATPALGDVWLAHWQAAGLLNPSAVKPIFATLEQALVIRPLGKLGTGDRTTLKRAIARIIG